MTPAMNIYLDKIINLSVYGGKIFILFIMVLYFIFAFILIRRLKIMNQNFSTPYSSAFNLAAKIHFFASLLVIILTFLSLKR